MRTARTKPKLDLVRKAEAQIDWEDMISEAVENVKITKIGESRY